MSEYFLELIAERRKRPCNDLFSLLATAELDGERMTDVEIVNVAKVFLVGGNETTMFMLTSAWHRLATDAPLAQSLRDAPEHVEPFIEEILRLEAPAQGLPRFPTRDLEMHGVKIPQGSTVFVMCGSANHDETAFGDADDLVLDRRGPRSFQAAPHLRSRTALLPGRAARAHRGPAGPSASAAPNGQSVRGSQPLTGTLCEPTPTWLRSSGPGVRKRPSAFALDHGDAEMLTTTLPIARRSASSASAEPISLSGYTAPT